jgi:hypothetical protein
MEAMVAVTKAKSHHPMPKSLSSPVIRSAVLRRQARNHQSVVIVVVVVVLNQALVVVLLTRSKRLTRLQR